MLLNDGLVMISGRDEAIYHEMIAHVPLCVHPDPRRVLVVGGGDGGTVREVLRHPTVEHVRLVEIDGMVIEACREHIPRTAASLDDPRVTVTVDDGVRFVASTDERYDVVIVDSSDPFGPATPLFDGAFYDNVRRILGDDGIVVAQAESAFYEENAQRSLVAVVHERFAHTHVYNYTNLTYPGGMWSFVWGSVTRHPLRDFDAARAEALGDGLYWYTPQVHRAAFALPAFQRRALEGLVGD